MDSWDGTRNGKRDFFETFTDSGVDPGIAVSYHQWPLDPYWVLQFHITNRPQYILTIVLQMMMHSRSAKQTNDPIKHPPIRVLLIIPSGKR